MNGRAITTNLSSIFKRRFYQKSIFQVTRLCCKKKGFSSNVYEAIKEIKPIEIFLRVITDKDPNILDTSHSLKVQVDITKTNFSCKNQIIFFSLNIY